MRTFRRLSLLSLLFAVLWQAGSDSIWATMWDPPVVVMAYRPVIRAYDVVEPIDVGDISAFLESSPNLIGPGLIADEEQALPSLQLPPPNLTDGWPEAVFPPPEYPSVPELIEYPAPPAVEPPPKTWWFRFELGVNGSEGNARVLNTRTGANIKRKTPAHILTIDWYHALALNKSELSKNESIMEWRWEALLPDSPWSTFLHNTNELDEFTGYDYRLQGDGGLSYWFLDSEQLRLQARAGAGVSREFGGDDSDSVPEASAGFDFEHRINHRQRLDSKLDYYPDVRNFNRFRARMTGGWEIQIDEADHLSLRFSFQDRLDSTPDMSKRPNDFTYGAQLVWDY